MTPRAGSAPAAVRDPNRPPALPKRARPPFLHQFWVLMVRYLELLWRDPRTLRLLILQAPLVSAIIFLSFLDKPFQAKILSARPLNKEEQDLLADWHKRLETIPPDARKESLGPALERLARKPGEAAKVQELLAKSPFAHATVQDVYEKGDLVLKNQGPMIPEKLIGDPINTYVLVYLLVVTILWFGCNNAAKEIVKEEAGLTRASGPSTSASCRTWRASSWC